MLLNKRYKVLTSQGFKTFVGINKRSVNEYLEIGLSDGKSITCSLDHLFVSDGGVIPANKLRKNETYLHSETYDCLVESIKFIEGHKILYDLIDVGDGNQYFTNGVVSHNCSFLGSGDNFVGEENIRYAKEKTVRPPLREEWTDKNMWIWEEPLPDTTYVAGIDIAKGGEDDLSCFSILKVTTVDETIRYKNAKGEEKTRKIRRRFGEQVAEYYGRIRPELMAEVAFKYGREYNNALLVIDITGGYGTTTVVKLVEFGYNNLYYSETNNKDRKGELQSFRKWTMKEKNGETKEVDTYPGLTIGSNRGSILINMSEKLRKREFIIRSSRTTEELNTFTTHKNPIRVADHERSKHDDSIFANSMALYIITYDLEFIADSIAKTKAILDAITKVDYNSNSIKRVAEKKGIPAGYADPRVNPYNATNWLFMDKQTWIRGILNSVNPQTGRLYSREEAESLYYEVKPFKKF